MNEKELRLLISDRIKKAQNKSGLGSSELSRIIGMSRTYMCQITTKKRIPSLICLRKIARACCVTTDYLMGLSE